MTLSEAIEICDDLLYESPHFPPDDRRAALKLLIEAGKRLRTAREWSPLFGQPLLPGETEN